jgi:hypothetical protein
VGTRIVLDGLENRRIFFSWWEMKHVFFGRPVRSTVEPLISDTAEEFQFCPL